MAQATVRVFGLTPRRAKARDDPEVRRVEEALVGRTRDPNALWAVIDAAGLVCRPSCLRCPACPLRSICHHVRRLGLSS